ncbi:MAG: signal peptidase I [Marinilabiliaceae bacterium]|nr:signal peptidase I [Marinilabiliaceae bacterium]
MINNEISNIDFSPILEEMLIQEKIVQIVLSGFSMFPFLVHNDIVQIKTIDIENLKIGDVVVFKIDNKWVTHRLIKRNRKKNLFYTRGDSKLIKDNPIKPEQIKGTVTKIVKSRWKLAHFAIGNNRKFIAFCLPVIAPITNFLIWVWTKINHKN